VTLQVQARLMVGAQVRVTVSLVDGDHAGDAV
jgi:hypothetical protein